MSFINDESLQKSFYTLLTFYSFYDENNNELPHIKRNSFSEEIEDFEERIDNCSYIKINSELPKEVIILIKKLRYDLLPTYKGKFHFNQEAERWEQIVE